MIAAIGLTLRTRKATKYQDPQAQLSARPEDRLKIVKNMGPSPQPSAIDSLPQRGPRGEGANVGNGFAK
jgi:hypothetical protein